MSDDEFEKLVGQLDAFVRGWEKEYNKKNFVLKTSIIKYNFNML